MLIDRYSFSGTEGQQIAISLSSFAFDTQLYLIGPNVKVVNMDDDGGGNGNSQIPAEGSFFTLPSSGTYIIEVIAFNTNTTGSYNLKLSLP